MAFRNAKFAHVTAQRGFDRSFIEMGSLGNEEENIGYRVGEGEAWVRRYEPRDHEDYSSLPFSFGCGFAHF